MEQKKIFYLEEPNFKYHPNVLFVPFLAVFVIWFIYYLEIRFDFNFNYLGIYPKKISGLRGIVFSPLVHSDTRHLFNNSVPLMVMLGSLYYFYRRIATKVLLLGIFITGLATWSFARPSYHIGASGVVYFLVSFIFFSGIMRKYYRLVAVSLVVVFLYGSMVWYIFPMEERISWEGHLSGFITGFFLAFIFRKIGPMQQEFQFSENPEFDSLFDSDGNFNPPEHKGDDEPEVKRTGD